MDSAQKRFSAMNLSQPWRPAAVTPTGTVNVGERLAFALLYSGLGSIQEIIIYASRRRRGYHG